MAEKNFLYTFDVDITGLQRGIQRAVAELNRARHAFREATGTAVPASQTIADREWSKGVIEGAERAKQKIGEVKAQLEELHVWQKRLATSGRTSLAGIPGRVMGTDPTQRGSGSTTAGAAAMRQRELDLIQQHNDLVLGMQKAEADTRQRALQWQARELDVVKSRHLVEQQINQVMSGRFQQEILTQRLQKIDASIAKYQQLKAAMQEGILGPLQERTGDQIGKAELAAQRELFKAKKEEARVEEQIAANRAQSSEKKSVADKIEIQNAHERLLTEQQIAKAAVEGATRRLQQAGVRRLGADTAAGQGQAIADIDAKIAQLTALRTQAAQGATFGTPEQNQQLGAYLNRLNQLKSRLDLLIEGSEQYRQTQQEMAELAEKAAKLGADAAAEGVPEPPNVQQALAQQQAGFTRMQRVMAGAFDGFQRRFEATLQFAISGALIFGVQRMVREFVQSAIEVERAFKDIETALEFDVAFGRGTSEFNEIVRDMRMEVLQVANDFNVLPAEANKAAFVMVSRFEDSANAMKAFRAQILATKVSGIDQTEVLRALTAVAEGFAGAMFEVNDSLTINEKLLRREGIAANLYGQALDLAVQIQQKFGVETEDVLEGTARATEVFRQMGFTMTETAALVSAVSRQLGQTGQQSAERLVRSIGQLTSGETRDKLLELAQSSDAFTLSLEDFTSGAQAWQTIVGQFQDVEIGDPQVAQQILQIIGQRREAEAVAAALGTTDLQTAIIAAGDNAFGAAERRFSFLADTVDEKIKSIATRFQELSQNVERIGALTPLKLGLEVLENLLLVVNNVVQAIEFLVGALESIPVIGPLIPSEQIRDFVALTLAAKTLQKILYSAISTSATFKILGTALQSAAGVAGGGVAGGTANAPIAPVLTSALLYKKANAEVVQSLGKKNQSLLSSTRAIGHWAAEMVRARLATIALTAAQWQAAGTLRGGALGALQRAAGKAVGALGRFAPLIGVAAGVATAMYAVRNAGDQAAETLKSIARGEQIAEKEAEKEAIEENLTPAQRRELELRKDLAALEADFEGGTAALNRFHGAFLETMGSTFGANLVEWFAGEDLFRGEGRRFNLLGLLPGADRTGVDLVNSTEWWEKRFADIDAELAAAGIAVMNETLNSLAPTEDFEQFDRRRRLGVKLAGAQRQLDAAETPAEKTAAAEAVAVLKAELAVLTTLAYQTAGDFEETIASISERLDQSNRDLGLGRITLRQAISDRQAAADDFLKLQEAALAANMPELASEAGKNADQALQDVLDGQIQLIDNTAARSEFAVTEMGKLQVGLAAAKQKLNTYKAGSEEYYDTLAEIRDIQRQISDLESGQAISALEAQIARTRDADERLSLQQQLAQELFVQSIAQALSGDTDAAKQTTAKFFDTYYGHIDDSLDQARRTLEAEARLSGPISNKLNQLDGQIASVRALLGSDVSGADRLEANVQLRELIAERNAEETAIWAAEILAMAGVSDTMANLSAQLKIVAQQMDVTAAAVGKDTAEWHELALSQQRLELQMALAELELEVIGDRLESDLTSPLAQATINLGEIIGKLANPDLGELDRARLELQKANAENARESAYFNESLFNLKFQSETGQLGTSAYISALQALLAQVDTTTYQGKQIFLQIQSVIDGLTSDISDMQFNIPGSIRLPTLFEVRRALEADSLGVNYQDNRVQDFTFNVSSDVDLDTVIDAVQSVANRQIVRTAPGSSALTLGQF